MGGLDQSKSDQIAQFSEILLNSGIAMMVIQNDGEIAFSTEAAAHIFGAKPDEIAGQPIEHLLPQTPIDKLIFLIDRHSTDATIRGISGKHFSGKSITLSVHVTHSNDSNGQKILSVIFHDISNEIEAERKFLEELRLSDSAVRGARIGTFEYHLPSDEVKVSRIWRELLELTVGSSDEIQAEWRKRVHPDDLEKAIAPVDECQTNGTGLANCEFRYLSKDGKRWKWMRSAISIAEKNPSGEVLSVAGAMLDITESKTAEIEYKRIHEQFRSAFENASIGMALIGMDGSYLRVNAALCDFVGYSEEQMLERNFQSITHPDDLNQGEKRFRELRALNISAYTLEKRYIRRDGEIVWGRLSVSLILTADGKPDHFISQIVDVTEQHRLTSLKSEFIATISHELRTPLTSIVGALGLLSASKTDHYSTTAHRCIDIAQQNSEKLRDLISDILDFEKFSSGAVSFEFDTYKVLELVERSVMVNETYADKFGVRYEIECQNPELTAVTAAKRFEQVMANLLSNAAKFADQGSAIVVTVEGSKKFVKVSVTNQGTPIPDDFRDKVFEPFLQADNSPVRNRGGTGLGLSIVKRIVEDSGGTIGFDSAPLHGTTFWFTIPVDKIDDVGLAG